MNNSTHNWFYMKQTILSEDQIGPISEAELKNLVLSGVIKPDSKVCSPTRTKGQWRLTKTVPALCQLYERGRSDRENQKDLNRQTIASAKKEQKEKRQREKSLRRTEKKLASEKRAAERELQTQLSAQSLNQQNSDPNKSVLAGRILVGAAAIAVVIVVTVSGLIVYSEGGVGVDEFQVVGNLFSNVKVKYVSIGAGEVTITDDDEGTSHVKIECNNGLVIDADWTRNPYNEFGYDIYEPTVSMDYNRMAVMLTARGVIASYLRGEYD